MSAKTESIGKKKKVWKAVNVVLNALLICTLSVASQLIYNYNRYRSFFVIGDSMYPFFNGESTRTNLETGAVETKDTHNGDWGNYDDTHYSYTCDYGLLDDRDDFLTRTNRFDVVVAYFDNDYSLETSSLKDTNSHGAKIKRLYAFPGESLYFDEEGRFFLKEVGKNDYEEIPQNESIVKDGHLKETTIDAKYATKEHPTTLKEGEYFVVGDNRRVGKSNDSRQQGPIGRMHFENDRYPFGSFYLRGRIVAITGKARIDVKYDEDGTKSISSTPILSSFYFPWEIKEL